MVKEKGPPASLCNDIAIFFQQKISQILHKLNQAVQDPEVINASRTFQTWKVKERLKTMSMGEQVAADAPKTEGESICFDTFLPVSEKEVRRIILSLKPAKSVLDPVPTTNIKDIVDIILTDFTKLINCSLSTGHVPTSWKRGIVTPLLKKEGQDPTILANLRPVTQLRLLARITEAIVNNQLQDHLESQRLLHDQQSGFRKGRGTELAISDICERLQWMKDTGHSAALVLLDMSAAFDTVNHRILLDRLEKVGGIKGIALKWFESFLSLRTQMVKIEDTISTELSVECGVPQGSALSPTLFNLYMYPLAGILQSSELPFQLYADDVQILADLDDTKGMVDRLVPLLIIIREWMRTNALALNESKTELLVVSSSRNPVKTIPWPVAWGTAPIPVDWSKTLGIFIDKMVSGRKHATAMATAAHFQINKISQIAAAITIKQRTTLVQALVNSRIGYGITTLLGATKAILNPLQKAQNRGIRLIYDLKYRDHISPARRQLKWLTISSLITFKVCIWLWSICHGKGTEYMKNWVKDLCKKRTQRSHHTLDLNLKPAKKCAGGGRTIGHLGVKMWNDIPHNIRAIESYELFKTNLKSFLLEREEESGQGIRPQNPNQTRSRAGVLRQTQTSHQQQELANKVSEATYNEELVLSDAESGEESMTDQSRRELEGPAGVDDRNVKQLASLSPFIDPND